MTKIHRSFQIQILSEETTEWIREGLRIIIDLD